MNGTYTPLDVSGYIEKIGDPENLLRPTQIVYDAPKFDAPYIYKATSGQAVFSTSKELAVIPQFIWDPNRYYRDLGLVWPYKDVTRKKLRKAYQRRKGYSSNRVTYSFKQLLTKKLEYDAMPLGERMQDAYTHEEIKRKLTEAAASESKRSGSVVTPDDILGEIEDAPEPLNNQEPKYLEGVWDYGFYLFGSRKYDTDDLEAWQQDLLRAAEERGLTLRLAIGYCSDQAGEIFVVEQHHGVDVVFLNENTHSSLDNAREAISALVPKQTKELSNDISDGNP